MSTEKPVAVRAGRRVSHYTYRGVIIRRWVNETGSFIGATTIYLTAGTKYAVDTADTEGREHTTTFESLGDAARFIDRRIAGSPLFHGAPARFYRPEAGRLMLDLDAEVAR